MPALKPSRLSKLALQGALNLAVRRPLAVSLEITHACNCHCRHCDKGGACPVETRASSQEFGRRVRELRPLVAQVSGGEPLLRQDLLEVLDQVRGGTASPYIVLCTNGLLLTEDLYCTLKAHGVDEFSISLDFPDERHDRNRGVPGLFAHLRELLPRLARHGNGDLTLISVIRSDTVGELLSLARLAATWGCAINFTCYTHLRTMDRTMSPTGRRDVETLRAQVEELVRWNRTWGRLFTTETVLRRYVQFFAAGAHMTGCRAGWRSLVVNPDGHLAPCAMQSVSFQSLAELRGFARVNSCDGCYVSLRANTERPLRALIQDALTSYRQLRLTLSPVAPAC